MCHLLAHALEQHGWSAIVVGPRRAPGRWRFRLGLDYLSVSRSAMRAACDADPDLIVSNGYLGFGAAVDVPRIHVYHGTMVGATRTVREFMPRRECVRRSLGAGAAEMLAGHAAARVVSVSEATAGEARRFYLVKDSEILPNAIDETTFAPLHRERARHTFGLHADRKYALFVGRTEPGKGADIALGAAERTGYELLIAGRSGLRDSHHLGILTASQLATAYAAADCVLLPTRYEACSFVVLEAIACGRPIITTNIGWVRALVQAVPDYARLLGDPTIDDVSARLEALSTVDTESLTARARELVLTHNYLAGWGQRWHDLAESVLAARSSAASGAAAIASRS